MPFACKFCIAAHGLQHSAIDQLPKTFEECAEHVERVHCYPVKRDGEDFETALQRVLDMHRGVAWGARTAMQQALGGPNDAAAALIEASGAIAAVGKA